AGMSFFAGADPCTVFVVFLMGTFMLAFLLGTWDTLDLERTRKGRVRLTKTFRLFFYTANVTDIDVGEYEGVACGATRDLYALDWIMFFILFGFGIIPGIIFFYFAFFKDAYYVSLLRDHGALAMMLYRGGNQAQAQEIESVVRDCGRWKVDVAGLQ